MSGRQFLREWVGRLLQLCREGNAGSASSGSPPEGVCGQWLLETDGGSWGLLLALQ